MIECFWVLKYNLSKVCVWIVEDRYQTDIRMSMKVLQSFKKSRKKDKSLQISDSTKEGLDKIPIPARPSDLPKHKALTSQGRQNSLSCATGHKLQLIIWGTVMLVNSMGKIFFWHYSIKIIGNFLICFLLLNWFFSIKFYQIVF